MPANVRSNDQRVRDEVQERIFSQKWEWHCGSQKAGANGGKLCFLAANKIVRINARRTSNRYLAKLRSTLDNIESAHEGES